MNSVSKGRLRRLWFNIHLWIGVGLAVLLIPLGLTGSALVWTDAIERADSGRAIAGSPEPRLPAAAYLAAAQSALGETARPVSLRLPERPGDPVRVVARPGRQPNAVGRSAPRARPRQTTVFLNPADARVLSTVVGRPSWWMTLHGFHENLLVRGWGRSAVGWLGVAMLISSLTGIWLWWPRTEVYKGLRFRRTPGFWMNLHYTVGFWISVPLAFVSLTGIGLGFPQTTRGIIGRVLPISAPQARGGGGEGGGRAQGQPYRPRLDANAALAAARVAPSGLRVLTLPTRSEPVWQAELTDGRLLDIDDVTGTVRASRPQPAGDAAWRWLHRLHGGDDLPLVWRVIVTLTGLAPTLLGVTGVCVWVARTSRRRALMSDAI